MSCRNGAGHTPLDYALAWDDREIVDLLHTYHKQHLSAVHIKPDHRARLDTDSHIARRGRGCIHVAPSRG